MLDFNNGSIIPKSEFVAFRYKWLGNIELNNVFNNTLKYKDEVRAGKSWSST